MTSACSRWTPPTPPTSTRSSSNGTAPRPPSPPRTASPPNGWPSWPTRCSPSRRSTGSNPPPTNWSSTASTTGTGKSQPSPRGPASNHEPPTDRGGAAPTPRPSLKDGCQAPGTFPARQRSLPQNPQDHKGSLHSALRADPCSPGEPEAAQTMPDREDACRTPLTRKVVPSHWRTGTNLDHPPTGPQSSATATAQPGPARPQATGETPVPCHWRT